MKNETEFAEYEIYDYPQENSHITGLFKKTIEPLLECLPYPKLILKMYAHFQEHKAKNRNVHNPAGYYAVIDNEQYLSALDNNYTAVYNQVYKAVSENEFEVFEFMKSFYAFCSGSADNSGVENGFILKYFLKSVQEKDHLPGKSGNVIVCDPSPKFIEAMLKESWFKHKAALYFTDPLNASVYFYEKELMNYDIWYENSFPKRNHTVCILIFGDSLTPTEIVSELKKLNEKTEEAKEVHVYLYCPNTYIDGKEGKETLHPYIAKHCIIDAVHIIDEAAFCDKCRKHSLIELRLIGNRNQTGVNNRIRFREVNLVAINNESRLISHNAVLVPRELYDAGNKTLTSMYRSVNSKPIQQNREKNAKYSNTVEIVFSEEIKGSARVERTSSGKYRLVLTIQNKANARQKREKRFGHGSSIYKAVKGKSKRRREIAIDTAYEILLENENLRTEVCKMLKKCYPSQTDYTIKTFWYVFLDKLRKDGSYNHKVAIRMFCQNKGVGGIKITQCTEADVAVFLQEMIDEGESESYIKAVLRNLNCLYHILGSEYENPCAGALAEVTQSIQKHREFRDGSIRRSFDMIEAKTLYRLFKADINTAAAGLARGGLISMFTPMGETEVCALCGENIDYIKSIDLFQFKTTHTSDYFSTERTELLCLDEQRVIPVSRILRNELMLDSKPFDSRKPIVCDSDGLAVTPKQLRIYISEKIKQVKIQKLVIDLPGKGLVDLNDYRGNWLRSNLDYALRNHSKISPEDLNYVMGRKFSTTDAGHYRDYRCSLRQIAISTSINRWADKFDENDFESSNTKSYIVNSGNRVREFYRDPDPYMIITDISIPQAECGMNLEFQSVMRFGGVVIVEEID